MKEHCTVILVNWNGWQDTIECLESLIRQDHLNTDIIIVDNDSADESVEQLRHWANNQGKKVHTRFTDILSGPIMGETRLFIELDAKNLNQYSFPMVDKKQFIFLIKNHYNAGFSKANNLAISFALDRLHTNYLFLLNNDTVIEKNAISAALDTFKQYPEYSALQSAIFYYDDPQRVWNLGGKILPWAQIKYYREVKNDCVQKVDFLSGCSLFLKADIIRLIGKFTEKFFHGEEDFEFSLRLKQHRLKAGVVFASKVYHKIGISVSKKWKNGDQKILNFALNRIIDMRDYYPKPVWRIWRIFTLVYFFYLMLSYYKLSPKYSVLLIREIYLWSSRLNRVNGKVLKIILERIHG